MTTTTTQERPTVPTVEQLRESANAKLTVREAGALRAQWRREWAADEAARARSAKTPRVRETPELASAARRLIRAVGNRCTQDVEGLAELARLRDDVDSALVEAIAVLRSGATTSGVGFSWADVGRVLGVTRQAAQQRYSR